jgi:hypothetical protein
MVSKKEKGGAAEIAIAPIVASGLLATATKLYRDMMEEQKKKVRRGGNAEVEAVDAKELDLFTSKAAPVQEGGKKRKAGRKPKRGGFEEEVVEEVVDEQAALMEGGKKKRKAGRKPKRGGFEEEVVEEVVDEAALMEGGKKKRKAGRKPKRGGFEEEVVEEVVDEQAALMEGGKKKRKAGRKPKRGGEALLEEIQEVMEGGKKRKYRKKKGGYAPVEEPAKSPVVDANQPPTASPDALAGVVPNMNPNLVSTPVSPSTPDGQPMEGGKGKRKAVRKPKRGGNAELLGLYESQLGGIASSLNKLVRG